MIRHGMRRAVAGNSGGGGDPILDIPSLEFYFDMLDTSAMWSDDAGSIPITTADTVKNITDLAGKGYNVNTNSGQLVGPTWKAPATSEGLYFNGGNGLMIANQTTEFNNSNFAVLGVAKSLDNLNTNRSIASHAFTAYGWGLMQKTATSIRAAVGNGTASTVPTVNTLSFQNLTTLFTSDFSDDDNNIKISKNGVLLSTTATPYSVGIQAQSLFAVGAEAGTGGASVYWKGYLFKIVGLKNPTDADIADATAILLAEFGI